MDLISVIVPVYNVENYLGKCVETIISQTYSELEIILVDDGSTDSSGSLCDKYSELDGRIKVIHKENGGLSSARNAGIEMATGKYVGFIDSDDYIDERMFELLYNSIIINNSDICICNYSWVDENGKVINTTSLTDNLIMGEESFANALLDDMASWVIACNKLYLKTIFDDIKYPVGKVNEDSFVIHYVLGKCNKIATVKESLYFYLQRNGSITKSKFKVDCLDVVDSHFERAKYYLDSNLENRNELAIKSIIKGLSSYHACYFEVSKNEITEDCLMKNNDIQQKYNLLYNEIQLKHIKNKKEIVLMKLCRISICNTYKIIDNIKRGFVR